jgi:N6-adenosine-specific RNA methylase IME4
VDVVNPLPDIRARAIHVDPPLAFQTYSAKGEGRSPQRHYGCLAVEILAGMAIADCAADDAFLFLWVPLRSVLVIEPLMAAWGFDFSGAAFAWAKRTKRDSGWHMGNGYGTRANAEICWLGRRGKPQRKSKGVRQLIVAPVREHSRKPDEVYARIESLTEGPYLDLFARQRRPGWSCWGDEIDKFQGEA